MVLRFASVMEQLLKIQIFFWTYDNFQHYGVVIHVHADVKFW